MPNWYLTSYHPLVATAFGRNAADQHGLPPFIDGSIRREPDLERRFPGVSCLCRGGRFAPRLRVGDTVAYLTVKRRYDGNPTAHWRLTAVLRVKLVLPSHDDAARWYGEQGLPLPSNCIVPGNTAQPIDRSHREHRAGRAMNDSRLHRTWDREYAVRARLHPTFVVCKRLFINLTQSAPTVEDGHMRKAFRKIPSTQNPGSLPEDQFRRLLRILAIHVPLSDH